MGTMHEHHLNYVVDPAMWDRRQFRVAVIGSPDVGKSRLVSELATLCTGRTVEPDTLMDEVHYSDGKDPYGNPDTRTIKCARIFLEGPWLDREVLSPNISVVLYDCPGHIEYISQIRDAIHQADIIIACSTTEPIQAVASKQYIDRLYDLIPELACKEAQGCVLRVITRSDSPSHIEGTYRLNFDSEAGYAELAELRKHLAREIDVLYEEGFGTNLVRESQERLIGVIQPYLHTTGTIITKHHMVMMFSGGKDSIVGACLLKDAFNMTLPADPGPIAYWGYSGYDFPELHEFIEGDAAKILGHTPKRFNNAKHTYAQDLSNATQMMHDKAAANVEFLKANMPEFLFVSYRASDEGVRSKDNWISEQGFYKKISPVFNFSEVDIWHYIRLAGVPVCPLYFKGYRSLGDAPLTVKSMPDADNVDQIIEYIIAHPETTERDGRSAQDAAEPHTMEKLRNVGFF